MIIKYIIIRGSKQEYIGVFKRKYSHKFTVLLGNMKGVNKYV